MLSLPTCRLKYIQCSCSTPSIKASGEGRVCSGFTAANPQTPLLARYLCLITLSCVSWNCINFFKDKPSPRETEAEFPSDAESPPYTRNLGLPHFRSLYISCRPPPALPPTHLNTINSLNSQFPHPSPVTSAPATAGQPVKLEGERVVTQSAGFRGVTAAIRKLQWVKGVGGKHQPCPNFRPRFTPT